MQSKVSMVVPCYNKEDYIKEMLNSVIAQDWNNLEIILVNDGSTDGTRNIITEYEEKLSVRGYEVVIIDQANAGCCAAVYAGLIRMSGDYFCLVDCDDILEPRYVSRMAGWLDIHDDYEWAACNYCTIRDTGLYQRESAPQKYPYRQDTDGLLEKYILRETITTAWIYMTRVSYLNKCGLIENFCTERNKTYEPLMVVPLAYGRGKLEFFNEPLYRYNQTALDLFRFDEFKKCIAYYDDYLKLYKWTINRLPAIEAEKKRLWAIARLAYFKEISVFIPEIPDGESHALGIAKIFSETIDELFSPSPQINADDILKIGFKVLHLAIENKIYDRNSQPSKRIIAYGALGRVAARMLPMFNGSAWEPTELWDIAGDGKKVKKPDFSSLKSEDILIIFPTSGVVIAELMKTLREYPGKMYYHYANMHEIIAKIAFPELTKASTKFSP